MGQAADITINDRAATPVAHTFESFGTNASGVASFVEAGPAVVADKKILISQRATASQLKKRLTIALPVAVTETINGVDYTKIDHSNYVDIQFNFSNKSTEQERADAEELASNLLAAGTTSAELVVVQNKGL